MIKLEDIKKVACVGSGVIGSGWAICYAMHGYGVSMYDINEEQLAIGKKHLADSLKSLIDLDAITEEKSAEIQSKITWSTNLEATLKGAMFIQENGPERVEVKRSILAQVEEFADPEAVYASSTSGLMISDIAAEAKYPNRCICAHPYNPAHIIPLVELTKSDKTDKEYVKLAQDFYQAVGKEAIVLQKECPGYIANRLQLAIGREAQDLILRGVCTAEDVDKAVVYGPGLRWAIFGPNMIMQLCSPQGLKEVFKAFKGADAWLKDMARWTEQPEEFGDIAQAQVDEMMRSFPDDVGHNNDECSQYRDKMLINILKLHGKF
ncbi:MAG: 3-hydroxyacyl-CoA dehydrogenase family protein [Anaerovoracaceae bacterium]